MVAARKGCRWRKLPLAAGFFDACVEVERNDMALMKRKVSEAEAVSEFLDMCLEGVDQAWNELRSGISKVNKDLGLPSGKFVSKDKGLQLLYCYVIAVNLLAIKNLYGDKRADALFQIINGFISDDGNKISTEQNLVREFIDFALDALNDGDNPVDAAGQLLHYKVTGKSFSDENPLEYSRKINIITLAHYQMAGAYWKNVRQNLNLVP